MATVALIVDWCGPHASVEEASANAKKLGFEEALYVAVGRLKYERSTVLQYVGISQQPDQRLTKKHHKVSRIIADTGIWIGEISSHAIAGRRGSKHRVAHSRAIELAEGALAYFLQFPLNESKRRRPPNESVVLISRWWKADFDTRWTKRAHSAWPDYLEYYREYEFARLQWFGTPGKTKRLNERQIKALALPPKARATEP